MTRNRSFTISRKKIPVKPTETGKQVSKFVYYVNNVLAGSTTGEVYDHISRLRHEEGHFDTIPLSIIREACDISSYIDAKISRRGNSWQILE